MDRNEVINKTFPHAFWGYDVIEVDLFLDEVVRELDRLHNELDIALLAAEAARQREERLRAELGGNRAEPAEDETSQDGDYSETDSEDDG